MTPRIDAFGGNILLPHAPSRERWQAGRPAERPPAHLTYSRYRKR